MPTEDPRHAAAGQEPTDDPPVDEAEPVPDDSAEPEPSAPPTFGQQSAAFLKELVVVVVGAIVVASLLRFFVGQMFLIPSESMENTLQVNDRIVVEKLSSTKRGEVVVFADPGGWLPAGAESKRGPVGRALEFVGVLPDTHTKYLTKRVIGLPGDEVVCCDAKGRMAVNGQPLDETSYLYRDPDGTQLPPSDIEFDVVVPAGRIFVMGDHRDDSRDSRCHLNDPAEDGRPKGDNAFVPEDLVVGRAIAIAWPRDDIARLPIPATYAAVPTGRAAPDVATIDAGADADC